MEHIYCLPGVTGLVSSSVATAGGPGDDGLVRLANTVLCWDSTKINKTAFLVNCCYLVVNSTLRWTILSLTLRGQLKHTQLKPE